jgi:hypothetical protein
MSVQTATANKPTTFYTIDIARITINQGMIKIPFSETTLATERDDKKEEKKEKKESKDQFCEEKDWIDALDAVCLKVACDPYNGTFCMEPKNKTLFLAKVKELTPNYNDYATLNHYLINNIRSISAYQGNETYFAEHKEELKEIDKPISNAALLKLKQTLDDLLKGKDEKKHAEIKELATDLKATEQKEEKYNATTEENSFMVAFAKALGKFNYGVTGRWSAIGHTIRGTSKNKLLAADAIRQLANLAFTGKYPGSPGDLLKSIQRIVLAVTNQTKQKSFEAKLANTLQEALTFLFDYEIKQPTQKKHVLEVEVCKQILTCLKVNDKQSIELSKKITKYFEEVEKQEKAEALRKIKAQEEAAKKLDEAAKKMVKSQQPQIGEGGSELATITDDANQSSSARAIVLKDHSSTPLSSSNSASNSSVQTSSTLTAATMSAISLFGPGTVKLAPKTVQKPEIDSAENAFSV